MKPAFLSATKKAASKSKMNTDNLSSPETRMEEGGTAVLDNAIVPAEKSAELLVAEPTHFELSVSLAKSSSIFTGFRSNVVSPVTSRVPSSRGNSCAMESIASSGLISITPIDTKNSGGSCRSIGIKVTTPIGSIKLSTKSQRAILAWSGKVMNIRQSQTFFQILHGDEMREDVNHVLEEKESEVDDVRGEELFVAEFVAKVVEALPEQFQAISSVDIHDQHFRAIPPCDSCEVGFCHENDST